MGRLLRELTPQIARRLVGRLRAPEINRQRFERLLSECRYDHPALAAARLQHALRLIASDWSGNHILAVAAAACERGPVRVLDFGGGFGEFAVPLRRVLRARLAQYVVVELPSVVAAATDAKLDHAIFTERIPYTDRFDVVFTSGTLQCLADPSTGLRTLAALRPEYLVLARNCVSEWPLYFSKKQMNGSSVPLRSISREELLSGLSDYELVLKAEDTTGHPRHDRRLEGFNLLLRRRAQFMPQNTAPQAV